jgi:hypothetical protein
MEPKKALTPSRQPRENEEPAGPPACQVCGSYTVPLRGLLRCSLCCFVMCQGCEGGSLNPESD